MVPASFILHSRNYVFAPVRGESAQPVKENQILVWQLGDRRGYDAMGAGWCQARHCCFQSTAPGDLICQGPFFISNDNVRQFESVYGLLPISGPLI